MFNLIWKTDLLQIKLIKGIKNDVQLDLKNGFITN